MQNFNMVKKVICLIFIVSAGFIQKTAAQDVESQLGWKLGAQAYTFNQFTFFEAVAKTKQSGMKYIEAFPGQNIGGGIEGKMDFKMEAAKREKILQKLEEEGVTLMSFGVVGADSEADWKELFDFAKAMGIKTIVSQPNPEDISFISDLCDEYKINLAIHNHPDPSPYWNPDRVLEVLKGVSDRVGACADVGHWIRSGLDPVASLKKLEGHIIELHFKDLSEKAKDAHDVHWGTGVLGMSKVLEELKRQDFEGLFVAEYEYHWDNNVPDVTESVKNFRKVAEELVTQ